MRYSPPIPGALLRRPFGLSFQLSSVIVHPPRVGLAEVPTVGEFVPGYEASGWAGIGAPKKTPAEIIDRLNQEINAILADPKARARITDLGIAVFASTPAEFRKHIADETEKWGKVIRDANIKPE
jgi:tripartite-type tricarboxylate transporter receptor subunit TctC